MRSSNRIIITIVIAALFFMVTSKANAVLCRAMGWGAWEKVEAKELNPAGEKQVAVEDKLTWWDVIILIVVINAVFRILFPGK